MPNVSSKRLIRWRLSLYITAVFVRNTNKQARSGSAESFWTQRFLRTASAHHQNLYPAGPAHRRIFLRSRWAILGFHRERIYSTTALITRSRVRRRVRSATVNPETRSKVREEVMFCDSFNNFTRNPLELNKIKRLGQLNVIAKGRIDFKTQEFFRNPKTRAAA